MPIYQVIVTETHRETVAEIHHAYRDSYYEVLYEVEADSQEEAEEIYYDGERIHDDWVDYGDYYDSEFIETLETVDSECIDETVDEIEEVEEENSHAAQRRRWAAQWNTVNYSTPQRVNSWGGTVIRTETIADPPLPEKPTWEV